MLKQQNQKVSLVFWIAVVLCSLFVLIGAIFPEQMEQQTQAITQWIGYHFSWYYLLLVLIFFFSLHLFTLF